MPVKLDELYAQAAETAASAASAAGGLVDNLTAALSQVQVSSPVLPPKRPRFGAESADGAASGSGGDGGGVTTQHGGATALMVLRAAPAEMVAVSLSLTRCRPWRAFHKRQSRPQLKTWKSSCQGCVLGLVLSKQHVQNDSAVGEE